MSFLPLTHVQNTCISFTLYLLFLNTNQHNKFKTNQVSICPINTIYLQNTNYKTRKTYDFLYRLTSEKSSFVRRFNEKDKSNEKVLENTTDLFTTEHIIIKRPNMQSNKKFFLKSNGLFYSLENKCDFQYFHIVASV